jgi:hypothetical protein
MPHARDGPGGVVAPDACAPNPRRAELAGAKRPEQPPGELDAAYPTSESRKGTGAQEPRSRNDEATPGMSAGNSPGAIQRWSDGDTAGTGSAGAA